MARSTYCPVNGRHSHKFREVCFFYRFAHSTNWLIVLPYFYQCPFFDQTSNNATLMTQATYNASMLHILQTREAFEGRLRTMQGLEFMVAFEPSQTVGSQDGSENVWVIRKQNRRKRPGLEDEITVLGSYFVVNENIYMAPSVGLVVNSVMVCRKHALQVRVLVLMPDSSGSSLL